MKKIMSLALSVLLLCMFVVPTASAEDSISKEESPLIEARYSDFSMVYATLHKMDNGFYEISGGAGTFSSQKWLEVTVTLEACGADGKYRPVNGYSWTDADYTSVATFATRDLSGGTYRTHTAAKCYLNGVLQEKVDLYSDVVSVPF